MKPVIVLPPDTMSDENIASLRENGFCVVVASEPAKVRFLDPLPVESSRTEIERAALKLVRNLFDKSTLGGANLISRDEIARTFVNILKEGTPLDPNGTTEDRQRLEDERLIAQARRDELQRLAREEVREEREQRKAKEKQADRAQRERERKAKYRKARQSAAATAALPTSDEGPSA